MHRLAGLTAASALAVLGVSGVALAATAHESAASTIVKTRHTSLGTILVTASGHTLYLNTGDKPPMFACTGGCLSAWPALKAKGTLEARGAAKAAKLGSVKDGNFRIVTYNGHPLYTFASDSTADPTSGEGLDGFYAVSPSGTKVAKTTTTTTTTSSTSSAYGY